MSEALRLELEMVGSPVKISVLVPGRVQTGISNALRNWPSDLGPVPEARKSDRLGALPIPPSLEGMMASPMYPPRVAEIVLDGIRNDRFWILTHPRETSDLVTKRTEAMVRDGAASLGPETESRGGR
jgi:hypothetical protein